VSIKRSSPRPTSDFIPKDSQACFLSCQLPSRADSTENGGTMNLRAIGDALSARIGSPNKSFPNGENVSCVAFMDF
jgi:hypothetical protein